MAGARSSSNINEGNEIARIPCSVCGSSSSGFHFGAITCEGCKLFFCRSMKRRDTAFNKSNNSNNRQTAYLHRCNVIVGHQSSSLGDDNNITKCRRCRLDKCLAVGMSLSAVCLGRHSAERRFQKSLTFRKLAESNQLLDDSPTTSSRRSSRCHRHPSGDVSRLNPDETLFMMKQEDIAAALSSSTITIPLSSNSQSLPTSGDVVYLQGLGEQSAVKSMEHLQEISNMPNFPKQQLPLNAMMPFPFHQLVQNFDNTNKQMEMPNLWALEPGMSQTAFLQRFSEILVKDFVRRCSSDSGVGMSSQQQAEIASSLYPLFFYNSNPHQQSAFINNNEQQQQCSTSFYQQHPTQISEKSNKQCWFQTVAPTYPPPSWMTKGGHDINNKPK